MKDASGEPSSRDPHRRQPAGAQLTMVSFANASKPAIAVGGFFVMSAETLLLMPQRPFAWREFLLQSWFVARVSLLPTLMLAIPFTVLLMFTFNILLVEFGAADFRGTGAAYGTVTQIGPIVTVLVVAGAGATAMCADLGARTIREELDALRVMGINPVQALVVPRVLAATFVAMLLSSVVILVGIGRRRSSSRCSSSTSPPARSSAGLTLLTGCPTCHLADQGRAVRPGRRPDRLLQGHLGRRRSRRRRQRGQRDRGLHVRGPVRDQHHRDRRRREGRRCDRRHRRHGLPDCGARRRRLGRRLEPDRRRRPSSTARRVALDRRRARRTTRPRCMRLIAQMSLGTGALAVIGGTVVIVGFLTLSAGALIAVQGYNQFADIGVEALTGFVSAYFNVRLIAPVIAGIGLAATIGAGATAQLGAMRINEEIDALEVMGIRSVAYLASTRRLAGVIVVIPLYCVAVLMSFLAARFGTTCVYGQSTGVYDHYFNTFLNPTDLLWSFFQAIAMAIVIMLVHTYYGYTASGGPAGVGEAVGRAVRASLVSPVFVTLFVSLAIYGQSGNFHLSG